MEITFNVNVQGTLRGLDVQLSKAMNLAKRDAIKTLMGYAAKLTAQENYITQSEVKKAMAPLPYGFVVKGPLLGMNKFKLSPKKPSKHYTLMGAVKRGGLKPLGSNAFLMRSGIPFARVSRKRFPIVRLMGPSIPQLVGGEGKDDLYAAKFQQLMKSRAKFWTEKLLGGMSS